uniref:C-type lectin domain-containing protein n=1 Tax=Branchiostoma floridae TaxID=7739 RepID=C3ZHI1_BRAFL|eukprot:XP_002591965.1 hypothetical protein BRAFLDRAFT_79558 [Branchiostoma floridae]
MYEQAQPVRTPVTGSDRKQNSGPSAHVPPNRRGNTSESVNHGSNGSRRYRERKETSSNLYEEAEAVKLNNLSGDQPHGTETSTDKTLPPPDGVSGRHICRMVAASAVVATAVTLIVVLPMFINTGTYEDEEDIFHLSTTVDTLNLGQNMTVATEQRLTEKTNMLAKTQKDDGCKVGYKLVTGICIRLSLEEKSYAAAKKACRKDGASLAMPKTEDLDVALRSLVSTVGDNRNHWIGMTRQHQGRWWKWEDGSALRNYQKYG